MLPSEFYTRYGEPSIRVFEIANAAEITIPADDTRYLIGILMNNLAVAFYPLSSPLPAVISNNKPLNSEPTIYTHPAHGSLVNVAWRIRNTTGPGTVSVMVVMASMEIGGVMIKGRNRRANTQANTDSRSVRKRTSSRT